MTATVADDETPGFALSTASVQSVTEAGSTTKMAARLTVEPAGDVVLQASSGDPGEATVGAPLTFTSSNWATPQAFTITGRDDSIADGEQEAVFTVSVREDQSHDSYDDVADQFVTATVADDDTAGIATIVSGFSNDVGESGTTDSIQVILTSEPVSEVVLSVVSSDTGEVTCLLYTSPSPRDKRQSRMPSSA